MKTAIAILGLLFTIQCMGQAKTEERPKTRLNIYLISKTEKFEFLPFTVKVRAFVKSIFNKKRMRVIVASSSEFAAAKIERLMERRHALIGNIWFDSHGLYKNGYSSFSIGLDNFNYMNIKDPVHTAYLKKIAFYADAKTQVGLGSCYGGATFIHPDSSGEFKGRMNGDSLMMGLGSIFCGATLYGSESWVMEKPGIFMNKFGFAGYPLGRRYRKTYWQPVWERLGMWNRDNSTTGVFEPVNTVALTRNGTIIVRSRNYQDLGKGRKAVSKNISMLEKLITNNN